MKVKVTIAGKLDLSPEDTRTLRGATPELVAQTLVASGSDVKVTVQKDKEEK